MQMPVCAFIAWLSIIVFFLVPKKIPNLDFVFLFCVVLSLTATSYTFFELNWHNVTVPRIGTSMVAAAVSRLITIPVWIMIAVNYLLTPTSKRMRWLVPAAIWIGVTVFDWSLGNVHVLTYHRSFSWNPISQSLTYLSFIVIPAVFTWIFRRFDGNKVRSI